jgi:hypothetical protein
MKLSDAKRYLILVAGLAAAAAGYTWYWHATADRILADIPKLTEAAGQLGYSLVLDSPEISGFPYRLIVSVPSAEMSPRSGSKNNGDPWRFRATGLVAYAQPWNLSHMILDFGGPVSLLWNGRTHTGTADRALLSLSVTDTAVRRLSVDVRGLSLAGTDPALDLAAERVQIHLQPVARAGGRHSTRVLIEAEGITLPESRSGVLGPESRSGVLGPESRSGVLGRVVKMIRADGVLKGWAPDFKTGIDGDGGGMNEWLRDGGTLQLDDFEVSWPPIGVEGSGALGLDPGRRLSGSLKAKIRGHGALIDAFEAAGILSLRKAAVARGVLGMLLSSQGDSTGRLPVMIEFQDGRLYLGPVKLMRLPVF